MIPRVMEWTCPDEGCRPGLKAGAEAVEVIAGLDRGIHDAVEVVRRAEVVIVSADGHLGHFVEAGAGDVRGIARAVKCVAQAGERDDGKALLGEMRSVNIAFFRTDLIEVGGGEHDISRAWCDTGEGAHCGLELIAHAVGQKFVGTEIHVGRAPGGQGHADVQIEFAGKRLSQFIRRGSWEAFEGDKPYVHGARGRGGGGEGLRCCGRGRSGSVTRIGLSQCQQGRNG